MVTVGAVRMKKKKKLNLKKWMFPIRISSFLLIAVGIALNTGGRFLASYLQLPIWFDSVGTFLTAAVLGPYAGCITGVVFSVLFSFYDHSAWVYSGVAGMVGIIVGFVFPRDKTLSSFRVFSCSVSASVVAILCSFPLNIRFYDGYTGNKWGDALVEMIEDRMGIPILPALLGEGLVDFPDKILDVLIVMSLIGIYQKISKRDFRELVSLGAVALVCLLFAGAGTKLEVEAANETSIRDYVCTVYGTSEGLASPEANAMAQTKDGYIWVGGYSGLYRDNGIKYEKIKTDRNITNVTCLLCDSRGYLWIGTGDIGVIRYNPDTEETILYNSARGLPSETIKSIREGKDHNIYVGTSSYLTVIRTSGVVGFFESYEVLSNIVALDTNGSDLLFCVMQNGSLAVLRNEVLTYRLYCELEDTHYTSISWVGDSEFYLGTSSNIVEHYRIHGGALELVERIDTGAVTDINCLTYMEDLNILLVGANYGMGFVDANGVFTDFTQENYYSDITTAFVDAQNNIWGTSRKQGVIKVSKNDFRNPTSYLSGDVGQVNCLYLENEELYIGTENGIRIENVGSKYGTEVFYDFLDYFKVENVRHINKDSEGNLWVCLNGSGGLIEVTKDGRTVSYNRIVESVENVEEKEVSGESFYMTLELSDGTMAAASMNGVYFFSNEQVVKHYNKDQGMEVPRILDLLETKDHKLLCCSDGDGVYVFRDDKLIEHIDKREGLSSLVVERAATCGEGYLYITSNAIYYDDREKVQKLSNFPYMNNYDAYLMEDGELWVTSSAGVYIADVEDVLENPELYPYTLYDQMRGMDTELYSDGYNVVDEENQTLYFCCGDGVRSIRAKDYMQETKEYILSVDHMTFEDQNVEKKRGVYQVPAGIGKVEISPGVLNFDNKNPIVVYYIKGLEDSTRVITRQSGVAPLVISNMKYGDYDFCMEILDEHTQKVVSSQVFKIHKEAKMYEKTYFRIYTMTVAFMFLFFLVWTFTNFKNLSTIERQYVEIKEAKEETERANNAKTKFLAGMSHEIRTPINAVLGMDEMILRESNDTKILEYANDIYGAGQHLLSLVNQILDSSKIESGKMEITPVEYDLGDMIHTLFNMVVQRTTDTDLGLTVEVDKTLPRKLIGDEMRIKQVMINLLTNAVKYTKEGGIWLRIRGEKEGKILHLYVEVQDTGIGIKEEDLPALFDVYKRLELKENYHVEGSGLGLNISYEFLQLMGSELKVESSYGKGSKFYFVLNQEIADDSILGETYDPTDTQVFEEHHSGGSFVAPEAKILVVDDNKMNRQVVSSLLKVTKMQIVEATGGEEAVEIASKQCFNMILMDHMMPGVDGLEAMKRIRQMEGGPNQHTPIYALTANAIAGSKERYLDAGFDGFIAKPIVYGQLEEAIKANLPEEMMSPVTEEVSEQMLEQGGTAPADMPDIDGLDWNYAWLHLPSRELLKESLSEFYTLIPVQSKKLNDYYDRLCIDQSDSNYAQYRILVHAMKGLAATVGLIPLAGPAKLLEFAARDHKIDVVFALHPVFMYEWDSYRDKIKGAFGIGEEEEVEKEQADVETCFKFAQIILKSLHEMDVDTADMAVKRFKQYTFSEDADRFIPNVEAAVVNLDEDMAKEELQKMLDILK